MAKATLVRLRQERAERISEYAEKAGLPVPALVDRILIGFIDHPPAWLGELISDLHDTTKGAPA